MFLNGLNYKQRKQFLGLAIEILSIDGDIDAEEESYLRGLCGEMALSRTDAVENPQHDIVDVFAESSERRIVIMELFGLAFSNNEFHPKQEGYIQDIVEKFSVGQSVVESCKELVQQYGKLEKRISAVIYG